MGLLHFAYLVEGYPDALRELCLCHTIPLPQIAQPNPKNIFVKHTYTPLDIRL